MKLKASLILSALLITACSSTGKKISYENCSYPDAMGQAAPSWICEQPAENLFMQAVGYSPKLGSGPGMMKDVAEAEARNRLATIFSSDVAARLTRLTSEQLVDGKAVSKDTIQRIQKNVTSMELVFARNYRTQLSPKGNMYVLVGIDEAAYKQNIEKLLSQSIDQDTPDLYRKFLLQEAETALDKSAEKLQ